MGYVMRIKESTLDLIVDGVSMPCVLSEPEFETSLANILLIPGSLFNDVEGNYPSMSIYPHLYADLSRQLASIGYTVLRYAKHGPQTGSTVLDETLETKHHHFDER